MVKLHHHSPICLRGVVFNYLGTGPTLSLLYPNAYLQRSRKTAKSLIWDSRGPGRDSNRVHLEYKSEEVLLEPTCLALNLMRTLFLPYTMKGLAKC
jgi:hypothetical protein